MTVLDDDLVSAFAEPEATVPVVFGSQSTTGILNIGDRLENDPQLGTVQVRGTVLAIKTGSLTDLEDDAEITVDGQCYRIREEGVIDDGKITLVAIAEAR